MCAVNRLVPFVHVADVGASLEFYSLLGFAAGHVLRGGDGRAFWAMSHSDKAEIMFAQADGPVDPAMQAVLFYMYSADVRGLRRELLERGLHDGGVFDGKAGPNGGRRVVFEVSTPHYMPAGELRIADPDGYCILVGQLG